MKVRIISAVVGMVLLVGVMLIPSPIAVVVMSGLLAAVAVYELLNNTGIVEKKSLSIISMAFACLEIVVYSYVRYLRANPSEEANSYIILGYLPAILLGVYVLSLLLHLVIPRIKVTLDAAQYALLLTLYATVGFGSIALLRQVPKIGWWLVILLVVIAWMSDTGAYFVGVLLGKHKMAPKISPKKTWEGFFGGWIISVLCAVLLFIIRFETADVTYDDNIFYTLYLMLPVAIVLAPLSVCGDLLASCIKRKCGIKDFGNIMPGHGGVMDRFDSVVLIAPLLYWIVDNCENIAQWVAGVFS